MRITSRTLSVCFLVCWLLFFSWSAYSYFLEPLPTQQATPTPVPQESTNNSGAVAGQTLPWKDYQEALKAERDALQQQARENLDRLDKLQDRIFSAIVLLGGLILGFIYFLFGQTREDVKSQLTAQITKDVDIQVRQNVTQRINEQIDPHLQENIATQTRNLEAMRSQMATLQSELSQLETDVRQMSFYKDREVVWFFSGDKNMSPNEIAALEKAGFTISLPQVEIGEPFEIGKPDLVIFTYDKNDKSGEAIRRLRVIAGLMKKNIPDVWLLIHTESNKDIADDEKKILDGIWYVPTNFSATLIVNAQALIRRRTKY